VIRARSKALRLTQAANLGNPSASGSRALCRGVHARPFTVRPACEKLAAKNRGTRVADVAVIMTNRFFFFCLGLLFAPFASGCSNPITIPRREFDAVVEYKGVTTRGVVSFPERDPEAMHTSGDESCGWTSGNCGSDAPTIGAVRGDAPISGAVYTTLHTGENVIYDLGIRQTPEDNAADAKQKAERGFLPGGTGTTCRLYDTEIGQRQQCYGRSQVFITLTARR